MNSNAFGKWTVIIGVAFAGAWMRIPHTAQILLMLMGLDVLSGIIASIVTKTMSSAIMVRGLVKKLAVFPVLALLHIIEAPLQFHFEFESMAALGFIVWESMSILEKCALAGVPIPRVIVDALAKAKVNTASADDIHREFAIGDQTSVVVGKSTEIVKTPGSAPDLKVDETVTVLKEKHIEPIPPIT